MRPPLILPRALLVGFLALTAAGCAREPAGATNARGLEPTELARVRVVPVEQREMVQRLTTTTLVRSERQVEIRPQASGNLLELLAEEGDRVEAGAVLARLDARDAQAAVREAQVALREAENAVAGARLALREAEAAVVTARLSSEQTARSYERNERTGLISEQELDKLRLERDGAERNLVAANLTVERRAQDLVASQIAAERAQVLLERAELALSHTEVRAPFDGHIAQRLVGVGDSVSGTTALFVLVDLSELVATVHRPQRELALFLPSAPRNGDGDDPRAGGRAGRLSEMEIHVTAEALPGLRFRGEVLRISPAIDPESGSFRVTIGLVPGDGAQLLPGMLVRLSLVTARHPDALVVPKRAVEREGEALVLWRVEGGRAGRVRVEEGFSSDDELEVLPLPGNTLAAGDLVVVVGGRDLEEGDRVEVVAEPTPAPVDIEGAQPEGSGAEPAAGDAQAD